MESHLRHLGPVLDEPGTHVSASVCNNSVPTIKHSP